MTNSSPIIQYPSRYYIAGGETLEAIERFIAEEEAFREKYGTTEKWPALRKIEEKYGLVESPRSDDTIIVSFDPTGETTEKVFALGESFRVHSINNGDFSKRGRTKIIVGCLDDVPEETQTKIAQEIEDWEKWETPQIRFAKWLDAYQVCIEPYEGSPNFGGPSATYECIDDQYIVSVPVVSYEDGLYWVCPPDSKPMAVSAYYKFLEESGHLPLEPTSQNRVLFNDYVLMRGCEELACT